MADFTKEQLKKELIKLKKDVDVFENARKELQEESPEIAELLDAAESSDAISAIINARVINIVAYFFGLDHYSINKKY